MKQFTAIYSTSKIGTMQYSFKASDLDSAVEFCHCKFIVWPHVVIVENTHNDEKANEGKIVWANGYAVK